MNIQQIQKILTSDIFLMSLEGILILVILLLMIRSSKKHRRIEEEFTAEVQKRKEAQLNQLLQNPLREGFQEGQKHALGTLTVYVRWNGQEEKYQYPVGKELKIGRDTSNDLRLKSTYIGRKQFQIRWNQKIPVFQNLGDVNPATLHRNGGKILLGERSEKLRSHDVISIGDVSMEFVISM